MARKTPSSVRGHRMYCVNYVKCAICYGCRAYNTMDPECEICAQNKKQNICNTELHKASLISKMITREKLKIDEPIKFKNGR